MQPLVRVFHEGHRCLLLTCWRCSAEHVVTGVSDGQQAQEGVRSVHQASLLLERQPDLKTLALVKNVIDLSSKQSHLILYNNCWLINVQGKSFSCLAHHASQTETAGHSGCTSIQ